MSPVIKLLYPFNYFRLRNDEKRFIDLWPTLVMGLGLAVPFILMDRANFFGSGGFLHNAVSLTAALTGFYVAALVAAATFSHPDLDKTIRSGPVALVTKDVDGKKVSEFLTRREFTCMMFGFLAFSTMAFTIYVAAAIPLAQAFPVPLVMFGVDAHKWLSSVLIVGSCLWISHIFVVTVLGLYYLMDRLYRRDRQITTPKPQKRDAA